MYWNANAIYQRQDAMGLTLTWDVLKCSAEENKAHHRTWLTLTWDVLKFETTLNVITGVFGLTLTWDVLKSL